MDPVTLNTSGDVEAPLNASSVLLLKVPSFKLKVLKVVGFRYEGASANTTFVDPAILASGKVTPTIADAVTSKYDQPCE
jgi:hypothetical protein